MPRLLLVRHGITESNIDRRFAGYSDIELSQDGYRQVEKLRDRLAGEEIDAIYSSDLSRTLVTAEVISSGNKAGIVVCPELRETNCGEAEGMTFDEIKSLYPELAEAIASFNLRQIEFPGGESFTGFIERTVAFLDRLEKHGSSEKVLVVSHSGTIRVLVCHLLGIDQSHWRQIKIDNASLSIIDTSPQGVIINLLNDTSHLGEDV